ncbi:MAG: rhodanese-like domain-containing protein, partial [Arenicellales bacterium]|nr:rhodanese-like domain-containing protein [Arenicellales bacterium]MEE1567728.1 rhodanese-like domain-containing protein [Arenicellales bacterium]
EGGGRAARLLWTLHYLGYFNAHVLNGGIHAWSNEGHPVTAEPVARPPARALPLDAIDDSVLATRDYVLTHLDDAGVALLDARTPEEYAGSKISAKRGGHIPGAINLNWHDSMDQARNLRLKPTALLEELLASRGINLEQEVIVYCQTHHRSAHTWMMLKSLGYGRVRGYAGSWSEWGNDPTTPVAQN